MAGAHEQRLVQALHGAAPESIFGGRDEWTSCAELLSLVARRLAETHLPIPDGDAGAQTAAAMNAAFTTSASAMQQRADQLLRGRDALRESADALCQARSEYDKLGPEGSAPSYTPHEDPKSEAGIKAHNAYLGKLAAFQADQQHREEVARQQNEQLDKAFTSAQRTMQEIHGQKKDDTTPPAYSGASTGGGGSTSSGGGRHAVAASGGTPTYTGTTHHAQVHAEIVPGGDHVTYSPGGAGDLSSPGGAGTTLPASAVVGESAEPGSGGLGLGGGAGIAGGAAAGIIGARLSGAFKGGGLFGGQGAAGATARAGVVGRGTAAGAVRGIGTSSRSGASGTLGRSGSASGASGRSGAGATDRSGSGARAGSGAAGRGGRGKDDKRSRKRDSFDVGDDWVGDDEAAPGVLD